MGTGPNNLTNVKYAYALRKRASPSYCFLFPSDALSIFE